VLQDLRVAQQHWFLLTTLQLLRPTRQQKSRRALGGRQATP